MRVEIYSDPAVFLRDAMPMLALREAENNLIIGRTMNVIGNTWPDRALLAVVKESDRPILAAFMTPPHHLVLTDGPAAAIKALVEELRQYSIALPGVCGPVPAVDEFLGWWIVGNAGVSLHRRLRIFQLDKVIRPERVRGEFVEATSDDAPVLEKWWDAFGAEIGEQLSRDGAREGIAMRLSSRQIFLWRNDGKIVSMAAWAGPTPNGVRINLVYTPSEFRNHGYASTNVAALSQRLLDSGKKFCYLFTDLANPTSNSIYQKIGYRAVCDWMVYNL